MANKLIFVVTLAVFLKCAHSQTLPANPCPNLFQYFQNNGIIYGRMEFPNDYSGFYRLTMNMSVAAYLVDDSKNIQLELRTSSQDLLRGRPLTYHVYFPIQDVIPKPTRIEFNQRVYCAGPPEELRPGRGVTNMWATTYYRITGPFRPSRPNSIDFEIQQIPEITTSRTQSNPFEGWFTVGDQGVPFTIPTAPNNPFIPSFTTAPPVVASSAVTRPTPAPVVSINPQPIPQFTTTSTTTPKPTKTNVIDRSPGDEECGVSTASLPLIVNGAVVQEGQFPWLVAMLYRNNFDYKYKCTGSLISKRHVLTAGHCLQYNFQTTKVPLFPPEDLLLVLGKHNIKSWANGALLRDVEKISVHPEYEQNKGDCDVAILTLTKTVLFEPNVRPVCLWPGDENLDKVVGSQGMVAGWGADENGKEVVPDAKKVSLPVVSQTACLRSHPAFSSLTSKRTFCAGNRNGEGPCYGDSGAGFVINRDGKWTLRGVVSTALGDVGTCDLNNYFVFADVAKVLTWVKEVTTTTT